LKLTDTVADSPICRIAAFNNAVGLRQQQLRRSEQAFEAVTRTSNRRLPISKPCRLMLEEGSNARTISVIDELDLVVTANMLRTAIRAKLGLGATRRAIWGLIAHYARDGAHMRRREEGGVPRLPVEVIPHERRGAFLDALNDLRDDDARQTLRTARAA
jgi:hypothetical protein